MQVYTFFMPLAQLNATVGGSGGLGTAPAAKPETGGAAVTGGAAGGGGATTGAAGGGAGGGAAATSAGGGGAATTTAPGAAPGPAPAPGFGPMQIVMIGLAIVAVYFLMFRGPRKEEKKRKQMIEELKKGDRVMTIGGLVARVVSIDGDEVVLKIDESANVKATYTKKSIQEVLDRDEKK